MKTPGNDWIVADRLGGSSFEHVPTGPEPVIASYGQML